MVRLVELSRVVRSAAPPDLAPVYGAVTALGGATFLMVALAALYWTWGERRREIALIVSFAFVALSVTVALKTELSMPRPPASARLLALHNDRYGFPSGHAIAAVVVYGGFVAVIDRFRNRRGAVAAAAVVAIVALSRVVLGVHYLGDVVTGAAVGLVLLWTLVRITGGDPVRGFAVAAVAAVPAVLVAGIASEAALALGGSLGGVVGARTMDPPRAETPKRGAALLAAGVAYLGGMQLLEEALAGAAVPAVGVNFLLVAGILALPALARRIEDASAAPE